MVPMSSVPLGTMGRVVMPPGEVVVWEVLRRTVSEAGSCSWHSMESRQISVALCMYLHVCVHVCTQVCVLKLLMLPGMFS